jgi:hypothetical protein
VVLSVIWAACLAASLARRGATLAAALPSVVSPDRAAIESGDPGYHVFLARVQAAVPPGGAVLLIVDDPNREDEFVSYRAAYELYPAPVHVAFRPVPRPGKPVSLAAADEEWAIAHHPGVLASYARPDPASGRLRRIVSDRKGRLETTPLADGVVIPPRPVRVTRWLAGVALVFAVGWSVVNVTRTAAAGGGSAGATLALAWVAGAGVFGWLLTACSLVHMPWTAGWSGLAGAVLALLLWRPPVSVAVHPPALTGWDRAGIGLVAVAFVLAVGQALVPQSAWSNWDAWAVWDFKVKAALNAAALPTAFLRDADYGFSHPEYPFGVPAVQAFLAQCAGGFDPRLLRLLSPLYALCVPALLAALLLEAGFVNGRWLVAGLVALLPAALAQSANGYLDWPVAATTTAALILLLRAARGESPAWTAVLFAGLAANMKNEAAVFGIAVLLALVPATISGRVRQRDFLLALGVWFALTAPWRGIATALDLTPRDFALTPAAFEAAPGRIFLFIQALALETLGPGLGGASFASGTPVPWSEWGNHLLNSWLILWFVVGFVFLLGWRRVAHPGARELAIVLAVQVAAAALAYILTIRDPRWLLASSLDRLLLQWVPVVVALSAALARPADQIDR